MPERRSFVILGGPPFESGANQTSLQMFDELASVGPTLYVCRENQSSSLSALIGFRRGSRQRNGLRPGLTQVADDAHLLVVPRIASALPTVQPALSRLIAMRAIRSSLRRAVHTLDLKETTLIAYWWMFPEILGMDDWESTTFDVVDRHWGYEYLRGQKQAAQNLKLSLKTAERATSVVAVSHAIRNELVGSDRTIDKKIRVLENGVPLKRIERILADSKTIRKQMTAVFVGGWNSRLDREMLLQVVQRRPGWKFTFAGGEPDANFTGLPNVDFVGPVDYTRAIRLMSENRVGLVPFVNNKFTASSSFLKAFDYLGSGTRVLGTPLPAMRDLAARYPDRAYIGSSASDWVSILDKLQDASPLETIDLSAISTEKRAEKLIEKLDWKGNTRWMP